MSKKRSDLPLARILKLELLGVCEASEILYQITPASAMYIFLGRGAIVFSKKLKGGHGPKRFKVTGPDLRVETELSSRRLPPSAWLTFRTQSKALGSRAA